MIQQLIHRFNERTQERGLTAPQEIVGSEVVRYDYYSIIFRQMSEVTNLPDILSQYEEILQYSSEAWQQGTQQDVCDLHLILVGPEGSSDDMKWLDAAGQIERDDRICRKLVWLPNGEGKNLNDFLNRTFLATPWQGVDSGKAEGLKAISEDLNISDKWLNALLEEGLEGRELIERLIEENGDSA